MISEVSHNPPLDGSDHHGLLFDLHCYVEYDRPTNKFSYDKGNYDAIREHLQSCSWTDTDDVNSLWENFASNLITARDLHIPTYNSSHKPSWKVKSGAYCPDKATRLLIKKKAHTHTLVSLLV